MKIRCAIILLLVIGISACASNNLPHDATAGMQRYQVEEGDTLMWIAKKFDLQPETILMTNFDALHDDPEEITAGVELVIPDQDGATYRVREGDRLESLASLFGVEVQAIINYRGNGLDPSRWTTGSADIVPGMVLFIPGAERELVNWRVGAKQIEDSPDCAFWYPTLPAQCIHSQNGSEE